MVYGTMGRIDQIRKVTTAWLRSWRAEWRSPLSSSESITRARAPATATDVSVFAAKALVQPLKRWYNHRAIV